MIAEIQPTAQDYQCALECSQKATGKWEQDRLVLPQLIALHTGKVWDAAEEMRAAILSAPHLAVDGEMAEWCERMRIAVMQFESAA